MKLFDPQNRLFTGLSFLADLFFLSFFWLILVVPIVTLIPASIALWDAIQLGLCRRQEDAWKVLWYSFKDNLASSIRLSISYCLFLSLLYVTYYTFTQMLTSGSILNILFGLLIMIIVCYGTMLFYLIQVARYCEGSVILLWQEAIGMFFLNPLATCLTVVLFIAINIIIYNFPLSLFILPAISAWLQLKIFKNLRF